MYFTACLPRRSISTGASATAKEHPVRRFPPLIETVALAA
jgi:hypothetical protein